MARRAAAVPGEPLACSWQPSGWPLFRRIQLHVPRLQLRLGALGRHPLPICTAGARAAANARAALGTTCSGSEHRWFPRTCGPAGAAQSAWVALFSRVRRGGAARVGRVAQLGGATVRLGLSSSAQLTLRECIDGNSAISVRASAGLALRCMSARALRVRAVAFGAAERTEDALRAAALRSAWHSVHAAGPACVVLTPPALLCCSLCGAG